MKIDLRVKDYYFEWDVDLNLIRVYRPMKLIDVFSMPYKRRKYKTFVKMANVYLEMVKTVKKEMQS